jgi:hypothetical protein
VKEGNAARLEQNLVESCPNVRQDDGVTRGWRESRAVAPQGVRCGEWEVSADRRWMVAARCVVARVGLWAGWVMRRKATLLRLVRSDGALLLHRRRRAAQQQRQQLVERVSQRVTRQP